MPKGENGKGGRQTKDPKLVDQSFLTPEITANGTLLGAVVADVNPKKATWSILSGNDDAAFHIDPVTGELFLADGSRIDYETAQSRELVVGVSKGSKKIHSATVTVDLTDVNEAPSAGLDVEASAAEDVRSFLLPPIGKSNRFRGKIPPRSWRHVSSISKFLDVVQV